MPGRASTRKMIPASLLTRELVVTAIGSLQETDDPLPVLGRFYESLGSLRHVDVKVMEAGDMSPVLSVKPIPKSQSEVPSWFVDLVVRRPKFVDHSGDHPGRQLRAYSHDL